MQSIKMNHDEMDPRLVQFLKVKPDEDPIDEEEDDEEEDNIDFTETLEMALSQLNDAMGSQQSQAPVRFPKPRKIYSMADIVPTDVRPATTNDIIDQMVAAFDNYPVLVQIMMHRGFLRKRQQCKKCGRSMHMRRRKNSYEWRCRTKDKRGDCSSCSIKGGSWFENNKLTFKVFFNLLIMHAKNCSTGHIVNELKLSTHAVNEMRKSIFELSTKTHRRYPKIGGAGKEVYVEVITVGCKKTSYSTKYKVLAGQEVGSKACFIQVIRDEKAATIEQAQRKNLAPETNVTLVVTINRQDISYASQNATFLDESLVNNGTPHPDMFFTNLRNPIPDTFASNAEILQIYLNDQVVRRVEGRRYLERCVEEIRTFVQD